jgi:hypothetical protein
MRVSWATIGDRGTAEGWPRPSAVPPFREVIPHLLAFASGAGRAMGMAAGLEALYLP